MIEEEGHDAIDGEGGEEAGRGPFIVDGHVGEFAEDKGGKSHLKEGEEGHAKGEFHGMEFEGSNEKDARCNGLAAREETTDDGDNKAPEMKLEIAICRRTDAEDNDEDGEDVLKGVCFAKDEDGEDHCDAGDGGTNDLSERNGHVFDTDVSAENVDAKEQAKEKDIEMLSFVERLHLVSLEFHRKVGQCCGEKHVHKTQRHRKGKVKATKHCLVHQCRPAIQRQPNETPRWSRERCA